MKLRAFVCTYPARDAISPQATRSLDLGGCDVAVRRHGLGENPVDHVCSMLREIAGLDDELALRVEDDVLARGDLAAAVGAWPATREPRFGMGIGIAAASERGRAFTFHPPGGETGGIQVFRPAALRVVLPLILDMARPVSEAWAAGVDALALDTIIPAAFLRSGRFDVFVHPELLGNLNPAAVSGWGSRKGLRNVRLTDALEQWPDLDFVASVALRSSRGHRPSRLPVSSSMRTPGSPTPRSFVPPSQTRLGSPSHPSDRSRSVPETQYLVVPVGDGSSEPLRMARCPSRSTPMGDCAQRSSRTARATSSPTCRTRSCRTARG